MAPGTISVVNLSSFTVTGSIATGHHPTGMAFWGKYLLVANAYDDSISVIDPTINREVRRIDLGLPIGVPGDCKPAYGAGPNSIAVDGSKTPPTSRFTTPTPSPWSTSAMRMGTKAGGMMMTGTRSSA